MKDRKRVRQADAPHLVRRKRRTARHSQDVDIITTYLQTIIYFLIIIILNNSHAMKCI